MNTLYKNLLLLFIIFSLVACGKESTVNPAEDYGKYLYGTDYKDWKLSECYIMGNGIRNNYIIQQCTFDAYLRFKKNGTLEVIKVTDCSIYSTVGAYGEVPFIASSRKWSSNDLSKNINIYVNATVDLISEQNLDLKLTAGANTIYMKLIAK